MLTRWAGATTSGACRRLRGLGRGGDYRIARNRCKKYQTVQFSRSPAELYLYEQKTSTGTSSSTSQWPTRLKGKTRTAKHDLNSTLSIICQVDGGLFTPGGPEAGTGTALALPRLPAQHRARGAAIGGGPRRATEKTGCLELRVSRELRVKKKNHDATCLEFS